MIKIGTAQAKISPPKGFCLCGYPNTKERKNIGVEQDLMVKALAISDNKKTMVLLTADLIFAPALFVEKIRQGIKARTGISKTAVMVAVSHTHSGPIMGGWDELGPNKKYYDGLVRKFIECAVKASHKMIPVKAGLGLGKVDLCHNRRVVKNGKAQNVWLDKGKKHTGPVDKRVMVMKMVDQKGKLVASLTNYSCHPVVMGPFSFKASPDFPGYTQRLLEKQFPGAMAFYSTGGGANANPYNCIQEKFPVARKAGETLGREVIRILKKINVTDIDTIAYNQQELLLKPKPDLGKNRYHSLKIKKGKISTEVQLFRIGKLLIVSTPGELVVEIANRIKKASPFTHTMAFGYTNDSIGYLPADHLVPQGGHEVTGATSHDVEKPIVAAMVKGLKSIK